MIIMLVLFNGLEFSVFLPAFRFCETESKQTQHLQYFASYIEQKEYVPLNCQRNCSCALIQWNKIKSEAMCIGKRTLRVH